MSSGNEVLSGVRRTAGRPEVAQDKELEKLASAAELPNVTIKQCLVEVKKKKEEKRKKEKSRRKSRNDMRMSACECAIVRATVRAM